MLLGLWHPAVVGSDCQEREINRANARNHVSDEIFVTWDIDDAGVEFLALEPDEIQFGKTQINGDSARFLLGQSVRISSGQRFYQRAFAMIDVARCGNDEIPSGHFAHAALIARMTTSSCCGKIVRRSSLNRLSAM